MRGWILACGPFDLHDATAYTGQGIVGATPPSATVGFVHALCRDVRQDLPDLWLHSGGVVVHEASLLQGHAKFPPSDAALSGSGRQPLPGPEVVDDILLRGRITFLFHVEHGGDPEDARDDVESLRGRLPGLVLSRRYAGGTLHPRVQIPDLVSAPLTAGQVGGHLRTMPRGFLLRDRRDHLEARLAAGAGDALDVLMETVAFQPAIEGGLERAVKGALCPISIGYRALEALGCAAPTDRAIRTCSTSTPMPWLRSASGFMCGPCHGPRLRSMAASGGPSSMRISASTTPPLPAARPLAASPRKDSDRGPDLVPQLHPLDQPFEGLLFGLVGDREVPVVVTEKTVRGSISNFINPDKIKDPANPAKEQNPGNANIQRIDAAFLPHEAEQLVLRYSIVVQGGALRPSGCDNGEIRDALTRIVQKATAKGGLRAIAERYAWNIVNARGLWRNRFARDKTVEVTLDDDATLTFHSDAVPTFTFPGASAMPPEFATLAVAIAEALAVKDCPLFLRVRVTGRLPPGAEVFPSQEFVEGDKSRGDKTGKKSRFLSTRQTFVEGLPVRQATFHSQKLGNAIRVIDDWHPQAAEIGAIAVEPYGYAQGELKTVRMPKRAVLDGVQGPDFYGLLNDLPSLEATIDKATGPLPDTVLYFLAVLVRGGVFSGEGREKAAREKAAA